MPDTSALPFVDADFGPLALAGGSQRSTRSVSGRSAPGLSASQRDNENDLNATTRREMKPLLPLTLLPGRRVRILALEAGGAGCLSSLVLLRSIMHPWGQNDINNPEPPLYPCQNFELVAGSEWGGVVAIMIARLRMSIQDCLYWFQKPKITKLIHLEAIGIFDTFRDYDRVLAKRSDCLRQAFQDLLKEFGTGDIDELLLEDCSISSDSNASKSRVLVLASNLAELKSPVSLRNYSPKEYNQDNTPCHTILDSLMAVVTLPLWNKEFTMADNTRCIAASVTGHSNPAFEAIIEAKTHIWDPDDIHSLLSLGCGDRAIKPINLTAAAAGSLEQLESESTRLSMRVSTDPTRVAQQLEHFLYTEPIIYKRFNVPYGVVGLDIGDWSADQVQRTLKGAHQYVNRDSIKASIEIMHDNLGLSKKQDDERYKLFDALVPNKRLTRNDEIGANCWLSDFNKKAEYFTLKPVAKKVKIAILDTGVDTTHPDIRTLWQIPAGDTEAQWLRGRYRDFFDEGNENPTDPVGHGTYVAGLVLQLAEFAEIYIARLLGSGEFDSNSDRGLESRIAEAIKYAALTWKVHIISLSFGMLNYSSVIDDALLQCRALRPHCVVFAAAGKKGTQSSTFYPARSEHVICMRSADAFGVPSDFNPSPGSSGDLSFTILGERVLSTWPAAISSDGTETPPNRKGVWLRLSGTSVATPIAAATAAQILHFKRVKGSYIMDVGRLERLSGIRRVLANMQDGDAACKSGHLNIIPWTLLGKDNQKNTVTRITDMLRVQVYS